MYFHFPEQPSWGNIKIGRIVNWFELFPAISTRSSKINAPSLTSHRMASCSDQSEQKCCRIQRATCNNQQQKFHLQRNKKVITRLQHKITAKKKNSKHLTANWHARWCFKFQPIPVEKKGQNQCVFHHFSHQTQRWWVPPPYQIHRQPPNAEQSWPRWISRSAFCEAGKSVKNKIPGFWGTTEFTGFTCCTLKFTFQVSLAESSLTINMLLKKHHVGMVVFCVKNRIKKVFLPKRCVVLLAIPLHSQL